jgi:NAD(P)H dehydrogenase (quinone)
MSDARWKMWNLMLLVMTMMFLLLMLTAVKFGNAVNTGKDTIKVVNVIEPKREEQCKENPKQTFAVFGGSSEVGQTCIDFLLTQSHFVKLITNSKTNPVIQSWENVKGVEIKLVSSYDNVKELTDAFSKVDGAFIIPHLNYKSEHFVQEGNVTMNAMRKALEQAKVPKLVVISSIGAQLDPRSHKIGYVALSYWLEQTFANFPGASVTFLRSAWLIDNYKSLALSVAKKQNVLPGFLYPLDLKREMVSSFDLGLWSGKLLIEKSVNTKVIKALEVQGPEKYSPEDIAKAVSNALKADKPIKAVGIPKNEYRTVLKSFLGSNAMDEWIATINGLNDGTIKFEGGASRAILGETSLDEFVQTWFPLDSQEQETTTKGNQAADTVTAEKK